MRLTSHVVLARLSSRDSQDGAQIVLTDVTMRQNTRLIGMAPGALTGAPSMRPSPAPTSTPTKTVAPTTPSPSTYHPTNSECECVDTDDGATDKMGATCANFEDARDFSAFELTSGSSYGCYFNAETNCIGEGSGSDNYENYESCSWNVLVDTDLRVEEFYTESYFDYVRSRMRRARDHPRS